MNQLPVFLYHFPCGEENPADPVWIKNPLHECGIYCDDSLDPEMFPAHSYGAGMCCCCTINQDATPAQVSTKVESILRLIETNKIEELIFSRDERRDDRSLTYTNYNLTDKDCMRFANAIKINS
jgi:hypothetical protein